MRTSFAGGALCQTQIPKPPPRSNRLRSEPVDPFDAHPFVQPDSRAPSVRPRPNGRIGAESSPCSFLSPWSYGHSMTSLRCHNGVKSALRDQQLKRAFGWSMSELNKLMHPIIRSRNDSGATDFGQRCHVSTHRSFLGGRHKCSPRQMCFYCF